MFLDMDGLHENSLVFKTRSGDVSSTSALGLEVLAIENFLLFHHDFAREVLNRNIGVARWSTKRSVKRVEHRAKRENAFAEVGNERKRQDLRAQTNLGNG
jgi:hypothetical protein